MDWAILWRGEFGLWLLKGLATSVQLSALAWLLAVCLGLLVGVLRVQPSIPLRLVSTLYVEGLRNIPLLVQLFFWYFVVAQILPSPLRDWLNRHGVEFWTAVIGLGVYSGARFAEVIRAAVQSVPRPLIEAALSAGFSQGQAYRYAVLPLAVRLVIPPVTGETLNLFKNSSLALTIGVAELTFMTRQVESYTARGLEAATAATLIYLLCCLFLSSVMGWVERQYAVPGMVVRGGGQEW